MSNSETEALFYRERILDVFKPTDEVVKFVDGVVGEIELEARTLGVDRYLRRLNDAICRDDETGVKFSLLTDTKEVNSDTDAILVPGPFGTKLETMVVIGEMIRRIAKDLDLRDPHGRVIPVVMFSAPVADAGVKLNKQQKIQVSSGDFRPIAEKFLETTSKFIPGLERASIMGVSFGGSMVPVLGNVASRSGIGIERLIVGVPGNMSQKRSVGNLAMSFASEGAAMPPYLKQRQGVFARPPVAGPLDMARQGFTNANVIRGLAAGQFFSSYSNFNNRLPGVPAYMFFTDGDQVARTKAAEEYLPLFNGVKSSKLSTPERHGVVYNQHVLGEAIATAILSERS